jgi:hypothetical protein
MTDSGNIQRAGKGNQSSGNARQGKQVARGAVDQAGRGMGTRGRVAKSAVWVSVPAPAGLHNCRKGIEVSKTKLSGQSAHGPISLPTRRCPRCESYAAGGRDERS